MRINELAKSIRETFGLDLKAGDLADQFRTMPEFASIRDSIKSHSSTVEDSDAKKMFEIYRNRTQGGGAKQTAPKPAASGETPKAKPVPVPHPRPNVAPRPLAAIPPRPAPLPGGRPPAPAPIRPAGMAPIPAPVAPAAPKPAVAPLKPMGTAPSAPATTPAVAPVAPAAAPKAAPAPAATKPVLPTASKPAAPGQQQPRQAHPHGQQVRPQAGQGGRPGQGGRGQQQRPRPSAPASMLRSSSGTTGISAGPETGKGEESKINGQRTAGQPQAPATPKFSSDSPFVLGAFKPKPPPTARPRRPERGGERGGERGAERGGPQTGRDEWQSPRPPREAGPGREGRSERPPRGGVKEKDTDRSRPLRAEEIVVPEIGVMKESAGTGRRRSTKGRPAAPMTNEEREKNKAAAAKKPRPSKVYGGADEFRRPLKSALRKPGGGPKTRPRPEEKEPKAAGPVVLTEMVTVAEFAAKLGLSPADLIKAAFLKGKAITINQLMDLELAEEIAFERDIDLQVRLEGDDTDIEAYRPSEDKEEDLVPRSPVVTIMGHVDHGKTSVLDRFRRSQVAEGEFGGITQHIGAYEVKTSRGTIVFLDTPGHEAFTSMRARGVQATDIVVLIVAADDGVMPQTIESINHARAANVPLIVAINKIDVPQADPERVRNGLLSYGVVSTHLGGEVEFVEISAKTGQGLDNLLEIISLQAEVMELKGNPSRHPEAVVIESHVDPLRGAVATVLLQAGELRVGQFFVVGQQYGRVRAMLDDHGRTVDVAHLSQPVELIGLTGAPEVGELLLVMEDERKARAIAERREDRRRLKELGTTRHISLAGLHERIADGSIKALNIILKADVQGSVEAISQSLAKLSSDEIRINILHGGTGSITESDVSLAMASDAIVVGFNIRPEPSASDMALREGVEIKLYRIIYELLEEIEKAMVGMLDKKYTERDQARVEVRRVFRVSKVGAIAGSMVLSGEVHRGSLCRLVRDGVIVYTGKVGSLRREKDDVAKVAQGYECGIGLENFSDVKDGDIIETYTMEELPVELTRTADTK